VDDDLGQTALVSSGSPQQEHAEIPHAKPATK